MQTEQNFNELTENVNVFLSIVSDDLRALHNDGSKTIAFVADDVLICTFCHSDANNYSVMHYNFTVEDGPDVIASDNGCINMRGRMHADEIAGVAYGIYMKYLRFKQEDYWFD